MKTVLDLTRILSAFDVYESQNDILFIKDLAKVIEHIVLSDEILITDQTTRFIKEFKASPRSLSIDLDIVSKIFSSVIKTVDQDLLINEVNNEVFNGGNEIIRASNGQNYLAEDINFAMNSFQDFDLNKIQFWKNDLPGLGGQIFLINQITGTRILGIVAKHNDAIYDPIDFRSYIIQRIPTFKTTDDINLVKQFESKLYEFIESIGIKNHLSIRLPLFFNFILKSCGWKNPTDLFKIALELRETEKVIQLRNLIKMQNKYIDEFNVSKLAKINSAIEEQSLKIQNYLSNNVTWNFSIGIGATGIPGVSFRPSELINYIKGNKLRTSLSILNDISMKTFATKYNPENKIESFLNRELRLKFGH